jgi:hypothetical protein
VTPHFADPFLDLRTRELCGPPPGCAGNARAGPQVSRVIELSGIVLADDARSSDWTVP